MVSKAWRAFEDEIARWRDAGRRADFWWRDDDANCPNPALTRLLALSSRSGVPLSLAVVPEGADAGLLAALGPEVDVLQHGTDHLNRAPAGAKKTEFPCEEPALRAQSRIAEARAKMAALFGRRALAVLAPPWNRLPPVLASRLAAAGIGGLSAYGARASRSPAQGVIQINTHVDIVAWRRGKAFVGEEEALGLATRHLAARRGGTADPGEPTGWLTHHACHDESAWHFLERLLDRTRCNPGVDWRRAALLFADGAPRG